MRIEDFCPGASQVNPRDFDLLLSLKRKEDYLRANYSSLSEGEKQYLEALQAIIKKNDEMVSKDRH